MSSLDHLTSPKLEKVKERLWTASGSLKGLSGLFTQGHRDTSFDDGEIYGIGQLLKKISEEISILEDILNCGYDSMADERNGLNNDKQDDDES